MRVLIAVGLVGTFVLAGCSGMPAVGRTSSVKDIVIAEELSRSELTVRLDDEVRWINKRMSPVRIIFLESVDGRLSCRHGFGRFLELTESVTLQPQESASVCVKHPGTIRYAVMTQAAGASEEARLSGLIRIVPR